MIPSIEWIETKQEYKVRLIDQTKLPGKLEFIEISDYKKMAESIKIMHIRGAPAIGVAAAMGTALAAIEFQNLPLDQFISKVHAAGQFISNTRPTAINLSWGVNRILKIITNTQGTPIEKTQNAIKECKNMWQEDIDRNRAIGRHGANLFQDGNTVLTHCNAGSLATVQYGTALAPIRWAIEEQHKKLQVVADETRPRLQGATLTAYELQYDKIPVQVECDNMSGIMMRLGKIQKVIVGADRIVRDAVFNKIGTYMVAIVAKYHKIPFYVAAPSSTLSLQETEKDVVIEQRDGQFEVAEIMGRLKESIVPKGVECINYGFDATPMDLVTSIITEHGVFTPSALLKKYK